MKNPAVNLIPSKLISRYGTRDPFRICREKGIEVMFRDDFTGQKGAFSLMLNVPFIFINNNLSDEMKRIVCAHELGHDQFHREYAKDGMMREFMLYDMSSRQEYEANVFAAALLLDDDEVLEMIRDGYDIVQVAAALHTDINLVALKVDSLIREGHELRVQEHNNKFLK